MKKRQLDEVMVSDTIQIKGRVYQVKDITQRSLSWCEYLGRAAHLVTREITNLICTNANGMKVIFELQHAMKLNGVIVQ